MPSSEEKPRGFTVTDRRSFGDSGEPREGEGAAAPPGQAAPGQAASEAPAEREPPQAPAGRADRLPPVDFPTFVLSLGSSALMHMGEVENPTSGVAEKNLPMAKHSIDILSMLQEKTKGNLSPPEAELLENLLYDLRLQYVEATKKK
jgi:hypothetical protein